MTKMTTTIAEAKMITIPLKSFIALAEELAADWKKAAKAIDKSGKSEYLKPTKADLSPELCSHIGITSAMHVLSEYYTIVPEL